MPVADDSTQTQQLLERIEAGDDSAVNTLLQSQRNYLRRLVDLRMEDALRGRVDPSDIVQETLVVISGRMDDFLKRRPTSFRIWARRKAVECLIDVSREHHAAKRTVFRQVTLSDASSMAIAQHFVRESPSRVLDEQSKADRVRTAIASLRPMDREVLLLRHVEELTNAEVAEVLELDTDTASKRYGRAVMRLAKKISQQESES